MTSHTPGPWRVAIGSRLEIRGPRDEIGWPVPVVYNAGLHTDETAQANARLIAAAPDLLAALEALTDWGREHTSPRDDNSPHLLLIAAMEAIAKATD